MNNEEKVREVFRNLGRQRKVEVERIKSMSSTEQDRELLYLITEDTSYVLEELKRRYLSGELELSQFEEFGSCVTNVDMENNKAGLLAFHIKLCVPAEGEGEPQSIFRLIPRFYGADEFLEFDDYDLNEGLIKLLTEN